MKRVSLALFLAAALLCGSIHGQQPAPMPGGGKGYAGGGSCGGAAPTYDNATSQDVGSIIDFNHTLTGSDLGAVVSIDAYSSGGVPSFAVTGVTVGGVALSHIVGPVNYTASADADKADMWGGSGLAAGSKTVHITSTGSAEGFGVIVISFTNVCQTDFASGFGAGTTATGNSGTASLTVTSSITDIVADGVAFNSMAGITKGAAQTQRGSTITSTADFAASTAPGLAVTTPMSWTSTSSRWLQLACAVHGK